MILAVFNYGIEQQLTTRLQDVPSFNEEYYLLKHPCHRVQSLTVFDPEKVFTEVA